MMKKLLSLLFVIGVVSILGISPSHALLIDVVPSAQDVTLGDQVDVSLVISGLGEFAPLSLGTFDLDVVFDPVILSYTGATFGDPVLGYQLDLFGFGLNPTFDGPVAPGVVNVFELSLDFPSDLDTFQAGSFTLATLTFDTLALGTSPLGLTANALGDADGFPLFADLGSGSVNVPEPVTVLLLGTGLAGVWFVKRKRL